MWALLAGERGQYELALGNRIKEKHDEELKTRDYVTEQDDRPGYRRRELLKTSNERLDSMAKFANEGLMIPEQIWDKAETPKNIDRQFVPELKFGEGTGSATPLAWSMAQFIRLAVNLQAGKNLDTPDIVYNRYVLGKTNSSEAVKMSCSITANLVDKLPEGANFADLLTKQKIPVAVNKQESVEESKRKEKNATDCEFNVSKTVNINNLQMSNVKSDKSPVVCAENSVLFFYTGEAKAIELVGDFTGWQSKNLNFKDNFGVKSFEMSFAPTARVEYKLIVDGKWITDPLNPNKVDNGVGGENSFFTMPNYQATVWDKDRLANVDGFGKVKTVPNFETLEIDSKIYGKKTVKVYLPTNEKNPLPTLYIQDGTDYINRAKAIQTQYNLVAAGKIKPFIMVFLDPKDRMKEYWANDDYAKYLATEVVPAIDAKYKTIKNRDGRAVLGASLGGITSVWVGIKYPEIFSKIGGQSSSFWIDDERVVKELEKLDAKKAKLKFYFDTGTLEGVEDSRKVVKILQDKGFEVKYIESEAGHNWTAWRDRLENAFVAFAN